MNSRILTNILDFGIKSKYRLCRTIVVLVGVSKANDIFFISSIATEQMVLIKTKIKTNKIRTLVILSSLIIGTHSQSRLSKRNCHAVKLNNDLTVDIYVVRNSLVLNSMFFFASSWIHKGERGNERKQSQTKTEVYANISKSLRLNLVANFINKHFCHTNMTKWADLIWFTFMCSDKHSEAFHCASLSSTFFLNRLELDNIWRKSIVFFVSRW